MGGTENEGSHKNRLLSGLEVWALALEEKLPETSLGSVKSEAWLKVGAQGSLALKDPKMEESER